MTYALETRDQGGMIHQHTFNSLSDALEASSKARDAKAASSTYVTDGFHETATYDEAMDLARDGWKAATVDIKALTDKLVVEATETVSHTFQPVWDVTGATVDVNAFLTGEPECMIDYLPETNPSHEQVIKILVNTCFSGGFKTNEILERGAGICALVEVLMSLNYSVEVWAETADGPKSGDYWDCLVLLKAADAYTDLESMAFVLAHPDWLRRIMFGLMEGETKAVRSQFGFVKNGGYGKVGKLQHAEDLEANVIVEGALLGRDSSKTGAIGWVESTLRTLGILQD